MGRNRNRNRRTNEASEDFFHMTEGSSRSNTETTITGGTRPKLLFSSSVRRIAQKTPYGTLSNHLDKKFQVDINGCMEEYEALLSKFHNVYELWSFKRRRTICELKELAENVHKDQLAFNSTNLLFKEINVKSRSLKNMDGSNLDFFASLATLATDVIGGVTSIAQACNVDKYTKQFNEIMEKDVEYTKPLYDARSNCFSKYKDVEEIVRHYHSETFGSTLNKISNTLKVDEMLLDIRSTKSGDIIQALELFDNFFRLMSREEVFSGVCKSVVKYVDNNPAVLDACESTGKVLYDVFDTWGRDPKKNSSAVQGISFTANQAIIRREETKISNLRSIVNNEDRSQAKLESTIQKALDGLEAEIREVEKLYRDSVQLISSKKGIYNYEDSDDDRNNFHANYNSSYFS